MDDTQTEQKTQEIPADRPETSISEPETSTGAGVVVLKVLAGIGVFAFGFAVYLFGGLTYVPSLLLVVLGGTLMALPIVTGVTGIVASSRKRENREPGIVVSFWFRLIVSIGLGFIVYLVAITGFVSR